jgi:hypothetical protein
LTIGGNRAIRKEDYGGNGNLEQKDSNGKWLGKIQYVTRVGENSTYSVSFGHGQLPKSFKLVNNIKA